MISKIRVLRIGIALALTCAASAQTGISTLSDLKKSMDDLQDIQYDLDDALQAKNAPNAIKATEALNKLLKDNAQFWQAKKIQGAAALAQKSVGEANAISGHLAANDFDGAHAAASELQNTCRSCHDSHPEKQVP